MEQHIHRQNEQDDDQHRADQEVAELAYAPPEVRLGLPCPEPRRDRTKRGPDPGFDDKDLRCSATDRGAEKHRIRPSRKGCVLVDDPGPLFDGKGLACHARLADEKVLRLDHEAVGRDQIACRE
jgi:hypothetical protein